jgi:hypothetical protein
MSMKYTYAYLFSSARYYYPNIFTLSDAGKTEFAPIFTIKTATAVQSEIPSGEFPAADTLNTYRFVFGQTEDDFSNHQKVVNQLPKYVTAITIIKPAPSNPPGGEDDKPGGGNAPGGGTSPGGGDTGTPDDTFYSTGVWDGVTIDVSWYDASRTSFSISTPEQLMGLAAIVNGIYNSSITRVAGEASVITDNIGSGGHSGAGGGDGATSSYYHYGADNFAGKTIYLTNDINMGNRPGFMPIGGQYLMNSGDTDSLIGASFCGTFDGGGHTVSAINCDRWAGHYADGQSVGLIGRLGVHDSDAVPGSSYTVRNVAVSGTIRGNRSVGGIVGKIGKTNGSALIENCANFASVTGTDAKGTGGIVGAGWNGGTIKNCYNAGNITNTYGAVAGISGSNENNIINCYNIGNINAGSNSSAAIASNNGGASYNNCYWLTGTAAGGTYDNPELAADAERTSAFMKSKDFLDLLGSGFAEDTRKINNGYPVLTWQAPGAPTGNAESTGGGSVITEDEDEDENEATPATVIVTDTENGAVVTFSTEALADIIAAKEAFTITGGGIELTFDTSLLLGLAEEKSEIRLTTELAETDSGTVLTLELRAGNTVLHELKGELTVKIPFIPPETLDAADYDLLTVYREDGSEVHGVKFTDGNITFSISKI